TTLWETWSTGATWVDVQVGDFNGDGKSDITGRALQSGDWWTGISNGSAFTTTKWATWSTCVTCTGVRTADFASIGSVGIRLISGTTKDAQLKGHRGRQEAEVTGSPRKARTCGI